MLQLEETEGPRLEGDEDVKFGNGVTFKKSGKQYRSLHSGRATCAKCKQRKSRLNIRFTGTFLLCKKCYKHKGEERG